MKILETLIYGVISLVLMVVGFVAIDLTIPFNFPKEIFEEKNPAVGIVAAGIFIAIAIIIRSAVIG